MNRLIVVALASTLSGCGVSSYTADTTASVSLDQGFKYSSRKNQENLKAKGSLKAGELTFEIETTASTPEAAISAALQSNLEVLKLINSLIQTGAAKGATGAGGLGSIPSLPTK